MNLFIEEGMKTASFTTKDGGHKEGSLIRQYTAFEGGMRYIIKSGNDEYRCIKQDSGQLVEYTP